MMTTSKNDIYYSKLTKDVVIHTRKFEIENGKIKLLDAYVTTSKYLPAMKSITQISKRWYYVAFDSNISRAENRGIQGIGGHHITNPVNFDALAVVVNEIIAKGLIKIYNEKFSEWSKDE